MRKSSIIVIGLLFSLAACNAGPSKSDAEAALGDLVTNVSALLGSRTMEPIKVNVSDLKCTKAGDDIYNCTVLLNMNGQEAQDNYRFTKLGGKWRAEHTQ